MAVASYPVETKRQVIAQVTVCCGCCCGNTQRGLPAVPVDWLKSEWRKRGLLKRVQLTISGCVGPCDVPNVVVITTPAGSEWLGNLSDRAQYRGLLEWAVECRNLGQVLELPSEFSKHVLNPFVAAVELRSFLGKIRPQTALMSFGNYLSVQTFEGSGVVKPAASN